MTVIPYGEIPGRVPDLEVSELRRAGRTLVRSGGYATTAIATLALALAAVVTIFGVVRSVILRPLPDPDSERIVRINHSAPGIGAPRGPQTTQGTIAFYQDRVRTLSTIAAWFVQDANLSDDGAPEQIQAALTTWQLCDVLATRPMLGRFFTADDDAVPGDAVVVLTHGLWSGADPVLRLLRQSCARHAQTAHGSARRAPTGRGRGTAGAPGGAPTLGGALAADL